MSEIYRAMALPELSFRTLRNVLPKLDHYGNLIFYANGHCFVLVAYVDEVLSAVKCYVRSRENLSVVLTDEAILSSPLLVPARLYRDEFVVPWRSKEVGCGYDIAISRWYKGGTLKDEMALALRERNKERLSQLAAQFDRFALQLLDAPFAHGDVKPENIIFTDDEEMRLIDLDAVWLPTLTHCEESGTTGYCHPLADATLFGPHIDDYPIALLSLILHSLAAMPELATENDPLPFESCVVNRPSPKFDAALAHFRAEGDGRLVALCEAVKSPTPIIANIRELIAGVSSNEE